MLVLSFGTLGQGLQKAIVIGGSGVERSRDICSDNTGNIVIVGEFSKSVDFDPGSQSAISLADSAGDLFIAKYDSSMNYVWVHQIRTSANASATAVRTDNSGNVYALGMFSDSLHFANSTKYLVTDTSDLEVFLMKLNSQGTLQWAIKFGGSGDDEAFHMELDGSGNVFVSGRCQDSLVFNASNGYHFIGWPGYIAKFDNTGQFKKVILQGGNSDVRSFKFDQSGNIYAIGSFMGLCWPNSNFSTLSIVSNGSSDIYVAKYNANGDPLWYSNIGGAYDDAGLDLDLDGQGNIWCTGTFRGKVDFNTGSAVKNLNANGSDSYILRLDTSGDYGWVGKIGGSGLDEALNLKVVNGLIYISGHFENGADFDPGSGANSFSSAGLDDGFVAAYGQGGGFFWAGTYGSTGSDASSGMRFTTGGDLLLTGNIENTVDIDLDTSTYHLNANAVSDFFLSRYSLPECKKADKPSLTVTSSALCAPQSVNIDVNPNNSLGSAHTWAVYRKSCGGILLDTSVTGNLTVNIVKSDTFYVRGIDGCPLPSSCGKRFIHLSKIDTTVNIKAPRTLRALANYDYKWMDCQSGEIVPGETERLFTPSRSGSYAVILSDGYCSDTSGCHSLQYVGLNEHLHEDLISMYPNPASYQVSIGNKANISVEYHVISPSGGMVKRGSLSPLTTSEIDVSRLSRGYYIMEFVEGSRILRYKLVLK